MTGLFAVSFGDIALAAAISGGIWALCYLAAKVVFYHLAIAMDRHADRPQLLDEYGDFQHDPDLADSLRGYPDLDEDRVVEGDTGRHAKVPPPSPAEMTSWIPAVSEDVTETDVLDRGVLAASSEDGQR